MRDYRCLFAQGGYATIRCNKILQGIQIRMNSPLKGEGGVLCVNLSASPVCDDCYFTMSSFFSICRCRTAGRLTLASTKACESDRRESVMLLVPFNLPQSSLTLKSRSQRKCW